MHVKITDKIDKHQPRLLPLRAEKVEVSETIGQLVKDVSPWRAWRCP